METNEIDKRDSLKRINDQLEMTNSIMRQNIGKLNLAFNFSVYLILDISDSLLMRGECIADLESKAEELSESSMTFHRQARSLRRNKGFSLFSLGGSSSKAKTLPRNSEKQCEYEEVSALSDCIQEQGAPIDDGIVSNDAPVEESPIIDGDVIDETDIKPEEPSKEENEEPSNENQEFDDHKSCMDYDITTIPRKLDSAFEKFDPEGAIHSTTIKVDSSWEKISQTLLGNKISSTLKEDDLRNEKNQAFDLLDAFSKSGALTLSDVSVHVILGFCHWFDLTLMETLIDKNMNPIPKLERSGLMVASAIFNTTPKQLVSSNVSLDLHHPKLKEYNPRE